MTTPREKDKDDKAVEEEIMSEVAERAMEGNIKILLGNEISHAKRVDGILEGALQNMVSFTEKANTAYLEAVKKADDGFQTHRDDMNKQVVENNRYTLNDLYTVQPKEAVGLGTLLRAFEEYLVSKGWAPPSPPAG